MQIAMASRDHEKGRKAIGIRTVFGLDVNGLGSGNKMSIAICGSKKKGCERLARSVCDRNVFPLLCAMP